MLSVSFSESANGVVASIYKVDTSDDSLDFDKDKPLAQMTSSATIDLKQGSYVVLASGDGFAEQREVIELGETPEEVQVNPDYSAERLEDLLKNEENAALRILQSGVPDLTSGEYRIYDGRLYKQGQWYGTVITKNATDKQREQGYYDVFKVVLEKNDGEWALITKTPLLHIGQPDYPNIPLSVLTDINRRDD